ncbi:MAG: hypothetical protein RBT63_07885, partial [Bdellovibrionales bacterium]|nr:hypothetical protein [Bdellovibrionales bacterium]
MRRGAMRVKRLQFKNDKTSKKTSEKSSNEALSGAPVKWGPRSSQIADMGGDEQRGFIQNLTGIEAPEAWSDQAVNIVVRQYLRKNLPDGSRETSIKALLERVVGSIRTFAEGELRAFQDASDSLEFEAQLFDLVVRQKASFNSPVWFNCGLWHRYGVVGNSGNWAWDFSQKRAVPIENAYARPQASACFIQSLDDDLNSIFDLVKNEARLFKYGSGSGTNFSNLRSRYEELSGGGTSSGLMSFLEVFDRAAGATKSGGTTRRAAKMVCLDLDHPEILEFIRWKAKEEAKAQALIAAGFSGGMDGEAYRTVSGQNSNNSVRVTDEFMRLCEQDGDWETRERRTGRVVERLKARTILRAIAESAWLCADPGIQYEGAIQAWHTSKSSGAIRASNPCSEFKFLEDTACNM